MADLEERLGSVAAARKVIGNLNNMVALRTKRRINQRRLYRNYGQDLYQACRYFFVYSRG